MAFLHALRRSVPGLAVIAGSAGAAVLLANSDSTVRTAHADAASPTAPPALDPDKFIGFKLVDRKVVTHNTDFFRFALPEAEQPLGLPVASCLLVRAPIGSDKEDGSGKKFVIRPYTPCSEPDAAGHFDLVVKVYPTGTMSKHIGSLQVGDTLEVKGPISKLPLKDIAAKKAVGMIAGGSGLTPMLQIAYAMAKDPTIQTDTTLIYANTSVGDIMLKDVLDGMAEKHSNFHVHHVVEKQEDESFQGSVGRVNEQIFKEHLPPPGDDTLVLVCGPPGMMEAVCGDKAKDKSQGELKGILKTMGYTPEQVFKF